MSFIPDQTRQQKACGGSPQHNLDSCRSLLDRPGVDIAGRCQGIGILDNNHFVFVIMDGRSPGYSGGVTLTEFAQIFQDLGCTDAYNLDGGGSSTMYFMGRVVNNPLGRNRGARHERHPVCGRLKQARKSGGLKQLFAGMVTRVDVIHQ